jgi:hypothetical protein
MLPRSQTVFWLLLGVTLVAVTPAAAQRIERVRGEPTLVLPPAMKTALNRILPNFRVRQLREYPEYLWKSSCNGCEPYWYRFNTRSAPFAVIGDFNGDQVLDVVVDGDTPQGAGRRAAILSSGGAYKASIIASLGDTPPPDGRERWTPGEGLRLIKKGVHESGYESRPLRLTTDAFEVSIFEKAAYIVYLRNGRWNEYITGD